MRRANPTCDPPRRSIRSMAEGQGMIQPRKSELREKHGRFLVNFTFTAVFVLFWYALQFNGA